MKQMDGEIGYPIEGIPEQGEAKEVSDGILWIRLPLPMVLNHVNAYAARDDDGWTIIDTGFDTSRTREIWKGLLAGPLSGAGLVKVIVTHHHPDHVGLAGWLKSITGAEIYCTRTAWLTARMLTLDEQDRPTGEMLAFYKSAGMEKSRFERRANERPFNFADCVSLLPLGFSRLCEGGQVTIGGRQWETRIGHGHAPEHATFWCKDSPLVIGGDQFLADISPNIGVYASEPDADPLGEWLESCRKFLDGANGHRLVCPGHKVPFTGLDARLRQLIRYHLDCLERLLDSLAEPRTASGCIPPLFRRSIKDGEYGLALAETVAHLNRLLADGKVIRERRKDGAWMWTRK